MSLPYFVPSGFHHEQYLVTFSRNPPYPCYPHQHYSTALCHGKSLPFASPSLPRWTSLAACLIRLLITVPILRPPRRPSPPPRPPSLPPPPQVLESVETSEMVLISVCEVVLAVLEMLIEVLSRTRWDRSCSRTRLSRVFLVTGVDLPMKLAIR